MGTLIDILSIIIIAVSLYLGYKKGFIKSIMGLASVIISVILAINFYAYPALYLKQNLIEPYFVDSTSDKFSALMNGGTEVIPPEKVFEDEPDALTEIAQRFGLDVSAIKDYYENTVKSATDAFNIDEISEKLSEFVVESAVDTISNVLGFAAVFFASLIVLNLLLMLINLLFKLPVLKLANKLAGALLGALKAAIIITVIINVAVHLTAATGDQSGNIASTEYFWSVDAVRSSVTYNTVDSAGFIF